MRTRAERSAAARAALDAEPGLRIDELAERLGLEVRRLAPLLWRMEEEGLVVHEGHRWYPV
jgi:DNA-binding IclR family transcriptional regulator